MTNLQSIFDGVAERLRMAGGQVFTQPGGFAFLRDKTTHRVIEVDGPNPPSDAPPRILSALDAPPPDVKLSINSLQPPDWPPRQRLARRRGAQYMKGVVQVAPQHLERFLSELVEVMMLSGRKATAGWISLLRRWRSTEVDGVTRLGPPLPDRRPSETGRRGVVLDLTHAPASPLAVLRIMFEDSTTQDLPFDLNAPDVHGLHALLAQLESPRAVDALVRASSAHRSWPLAVSWPVLEAAQKVMRDVPVRKVRRRLRGRTVRLVNQTSGQLLLPSLIPLRVIGNQSVRDILNAHPPTQKECGHPLRPEQTPASVGPSQALEPFAETLGRWAPVVRYGLPNHLAEARELALRAVAHMPLWFWRTLQQVYELAGMELVLQEASTWLRMQQASALTWAAQALQTFLDSPSSKPHWSRPEPWSLVALLIWDGKAPWPAVDVLWKEVEASVEVVGLRETARQLRERMASSPARAESQLANALKWLATTHEIVTPSVSKLTRHAAKPRSTLRGRMPVVPQLSRVLSPYFALNRGETFVLLKDGTYLRAAEVRDLDGHLAMLLADGWRDVDPADVVHAFVLKGQDLAQLPTPPPQLPTPPPNKALPSVSPVSSTPPSLSNSTPEPK